MEKNEIFAQLEINPEESTENLFMVADEGALVAAHENVTINMETLFENAQVIFECGDAHYKDDSDELVTVWHKAPITDFVPNQSEIGYYDVCCPEGKTPEDGYASFISYEFLSDELKAAFDKHYGAINETEEDPETEAAEEALQPNQEEL